MQKVGNKKLKSMKDTMIFRRGILRAEWEHKRMKMKIVNLQESLKDVESVTVTKEIQTFLKMKSKGLSRELTYEQEIELIKKSFLRLLEEKKHALRDIKLTINKTITSSRNLDIKIANINVDICEFKLQYDEKMEYQEKGITHFR